MEEKILIDRELVDSMSLELVGRKPTDKEFLSIIKLTSLEIMIDVLGDYICIELDPDLYEKRWGERS